MRTMRCRQLLAAILLAAAGHAADGSVVDRPYRPAWPPEKVADHIRSQSGTHFDPALVGVFLEALAIYEEKIENRKGVTLSSPQGR